MKEGSIDIAILETPLSIDSAFLYVLDERAGGNAIFIGTTRTSSKGERVTHLDFESYIPMAKKEMQKIAEEAMVRFGVLRVAIYHRIGYVGPKEIAVIIAASAPHRDAAFAACRFAIDTLKETVPIWKKEHLESGEVWVNAHP